MSDKQYTEAEYKAFRKKWDKEHRSDHEKEMTRLWYVLMALLVITFIVKGFENGILS